MIKIGNFEIHEKDLKKLYIDEKKSSIQIAKLYDTNKSNVLKALKKIGVERRKANTYPELNEKLLKELYIEQKLSTRSIAEIIGCSNNLVNKKIRKYNIPIRQNAGDPSFSLLERKTKWGKKNEEHPLWKGGVTRVSGLIRNRLSYLSDLCFQRDGYSCINCGNPRNLHSHHLKPFSQILQEILNEHFKIDLLDEQSRLDFVEICEKDYRLTDLDNLVTLCESCHHNVHTESPVEVINYDILDKRWRDFVRKNHKSLTVSEMGKEIKVLPYRIISFMKKESLSFAYENREWLEKRMNESRFISEIAREFNSRKYPCRSEDIRSVAISMGLMEDFEEEYSKYIIESYSNGVSTNFLAKELKTSKSKISEILSKNGIQVKNKRIRDDIDVYKIVSLFRQGKSIIQIAKQYNASTQTITTLLKNNGIDTSSNHLRNDIDINVIVKMYTQDKLTIKNIAKHFNSSSRTISNKLKDAGISVVGGSTNHEIKAEEVLMMYQDGFSVSEIVKKLGVSDSIIRNRLKKHGISFKKEIDHQAIVRLYQEGLNRGQIAKKLSISEITVTKYLNINGIEVRNKTWRDDLNSKNNLKEIEDLYKAGKNISEIAQIFNCSDGTIAKRLKIRRPMLKDRISKEELNELLNIQGKNMQIIADYYNTSRGGIWKLAKNYGLIE